jgi:hypothetical protein
MKSIVKIANTVAIFHRGTSMYCVKGENEKTFV